MKIKIEHIERTGFMNKGWTLQVAVEFTEKELATIKAAGLEDYVFFEAEQPKISEDTNRYLVKDLVRITQKIGHVAWHYPDRASCTHHEGRVKEALVLLSEAIKQNSAPLEAKTFEL